MFASVDNWACRLGRQFWVCALGALHGCSDVRGGTDVVGRMSEACDCLIFWVEVFMMTMSSMPLVWEILYTVHNST